MYVCYVWLMRIFSEVCWITHCAKVMVINEVRTRNTFLVLYVKRKLETERFQPLCNPSSGNKMFWLCFPFQSNYLWSRSSSLNLTILEILYLWRVVFSTPFWLLLNMKYVMNVLYSVSMATGKIHQTLHSFSSQSKATQRSPTRKHSDECDNPSEMPPTQYYNLQDVVAFYLNRVKVLRFLIS